jgi:hypothetical protein
VERDIDLLTKNQSLAELKDVVGYSPGHIKPIQFSPVFFFSGRGRRQKIPGNPQNVSRHEKWSRRRGFKPYAIEIHTCFAIYTAT